MPILDKTFSGVNKVIKCLILSCFHVNILYVSVALGQPPVKYVSNFFKSIWRDFEERPKMLIPGGGMLLPSRSVINQNTEPIKPISQPSVNTPPLAAVDASQNNLLKESSDNDISYNNYGTDLSDHDTDSLVDRNDILHTYIEIDPTIPDSYRVIELDYDTDSLVEINNNSDNSSLIDSSDHDADSLLGISNIPDNLFTSLDSTNISNKPVTSQDTEPVIPIHNHPNANTMLPSAEVVVREELIIPERAVVLAEAPGGGGGVPPGGGGGVPPEGGGGVPPGGGGGVPPGGGGGVPPEGVVEYPPGGVVEHPPEEVVEYPPGGVVEHPPEEVVEHQQKEVVKHQQKKVVEHHLQESGGTPPGGGGGTPPEKKAVPAIEAASPVDVTTNPENIAIALLQKQKETIRVVTLAVNEIIILSYEFANSTIDLRLTNLRHLNNLTALAAGDEANIVPKNLWISGTIGTAKYNGESMLSGYSGRTSATTIGGDIELSSGSIIGGAYNYVLANFKYKERINKVAAHTHVISIYGQTNLSEKLILQGFISFALGNVSAKLPVQNQLVKAKFTNTSYSKKLLVAYKSRVGTVLITPHIGFKCGWYNIAGYDENFERQSLSVAATNNQRASGVIGFEVIMPLKINNTIQVTPGLHMEAEKFLHNKQQKLRMQIMSGQSNNREEVFLLEEPAKYYYKIGGTINIKRGPTDIMAVYDYLVSNAKYSSHQGSLKLKLSF
ncbi:MAG: autotransporter outer membrane beta-barrel domain-containing protein [Rickettsia endosymbiont of Pseudomimeciton antennatum]|nr:autotransporter outer membrane beta-barrel domain-containing protein [Rickettsia endosymbiont of Pseudomimeciton antennatum]